MGEGLAEMSEGALAMSTFDWTVGESDNGLDEVWIDFYATAAVPAGEHQSAEHRSAGQNVRRRWWQGLRGGAVSGALGVAAAAVLVGIVAPTLASAWSRGLWVLTQELAR